MVLLGLGAILAIVFCHLQGCHCWRCSANAPQMFFQAVFVVCPIWAHIYTAKGSCKRITLLWDSHQLAGLTMVLSRDQGVPGLCWGSFALMIVDLTFHEQWHICQVRRWPSYSGSFAWLGSHPSLWLLDSQTNLLNCFALQFLSCSQLRGTNQCCCEGWKQNSFVQC